MITYEIAGSDGSDLGTFVLPAAAGEAAIAGSVVAVLALVEGTTVQIHAAGAEWVVRYDDQRVTVGVS